MCLNTSEAVILLDKNSDLRSDRVYSLTATWMFFTLFRFLISHLVPAGSPCLLTETFTSQRSDPWNPSARLHRIEGRRATCSMFPSLAATERSNACKVLTYSPASSGDLQGFSGKNGHGVGEYTSCRDPTRSPGGQFRPYSDLWRTSRDEHRRWICLCPELLERYGWTEGGGAEERTCSN